MTDRSRLRIVVLRVVVVSILLTLLGRLSYLQVAEGDFYTKSAAQNRIRQVITPAARGQILDDRGLPLVSNRTALVVSVTRSIIRSQPHRGAEVLNRLGHVVGLPAAQIALLITPCGEKQKDGTRANKETGCWNGSPLQAVPIKSYSSDNPAEVKRVLAIEEHAEDFPGVEAKYAAVREYPGGSLAAHALGYVGPLSDKQSKEPKNVGRPSGALTGQAGLEAVYDDQLRGVDGVQRLIVDKDATVTGTLGTVDARAGDDLVLSIDSGVQKVAESALKQGIEAARTRFDKNRGQNYAAPSGAAIVVDVRTGRLVSLASYPTYDPSLFVPRISKTDYDALQKAPGQPLTSKATQGEYAPGSTFKISSTAAAVAAGNSLYGTYPCTSSFQAGRTFRNFEGEAFGNINFTTTLVKSCDTVYYRLAYNEWLKDGKTKNTGRAREIFTRTARAFGFGTDTGVDLPSESNGSITDRESKVKAWEKSKKYYCTKARTGYPEVADTARAAYLKALAVEFCADGYVYKGGDAILFSIGQGDALVTPLQLAMAYSALANGGTLWEPRLAKGFLSPDGKTYSEVPPQRKGSLGVPRQVLDYMRVALTGVPRPGGTAQTAFAGFPLDQVQVAGKTGTADAFGKAPTAWFASFAPADAPKYAVVVMITEAGTGGSASAPVARKIYDAMYGFSGQKRLLDANGELPSALPVVRPDGTIGAPGTRVPVPPVKVPLVKAPMPTVSSSPTTDKALGGPPALPWAEAPRRRGLA